jgi:hypothetical protein
MESSASLKCRLCAYARRPHRIRAPSPSHAPFVQAIERVFEADLDNAKHGTGATPELHEPALVWSPVDSRPKLLADAAITYVGSVNFSKNSTTKARELGVIFANKPAAKTIASAFDEDWGRAVALPDPPPACP